MPPPPKKEVKTSPGPLAGGGGGNLKFNPSQLDTAELEAQRQGISIEEMRTDLNY